MSSKKFHFFIILHKGWEMDNFGYVEEDDKYKRTLHTTNHGKKCIMSKEQLLDKIEETKASLDGLLKAKELMNY